MFSYVDRYYNKPYSIQELLEAARNLEKDSDWLEHQRNFIKEINKSFEDLEKRSRPTRELLNRSYGI